jgi:hypothetical protein
MLPLLAVPLLTIFIVDAEIEPIEIAVVKGQLRRRGLARGDDGGTGRRNRRRGGIGRPRGSSIRPPYLERCRVAAERQEGDSG